MKRHEKREFNSSQSSSPSTHNPIRVGKSKVHKAKKQYSLGNPKGQLIVDLFQFAYDTPIMGVKCPSETGYLNRRDIVEFPSGLFLQLDYLLRANGNGVFFRLGKRVRKADLWAVSLNGFDIARRIAAREHFIMLPRRVGNGADASPKTNFIRDEDLKACRTTRRSLSAKVRNTVSEIIETLATKSKEIVGGLMSAYPSGLGQPRLPLNSARWRQKIVTLELAYDVSLPNTIKLKKDRNLAARWNNVVGTHNEFSALDRKNRSAVHVTGWDAPIRFEDNHPLSGDGHKIKLYLKDPNEAAGRQLWRFEIVFKNLVLSPEASTYPKLLRLAVKEAERILTPILNGRVHDSRHLQNDLMNKLGYSEPVAMRIAKVLKAENWVIVNRENCHIAYHQLKPMIDASVLVADKRIRPKRQRLASYRFLMDRFKQLPCGWYENEKTKSKKPRYPVLRSFFNSQMKGLLADSTHELQKYLSQSFSVSRLSNVSTIWDKLRQG